MIPKAPPPIVTPTRQMGLPRPLRLSELAPPRGLGSATRRCGANLLAICWVLHLLCGCDATDPVQSRAPGAIAWNSDNTIVCLGTSLTYGWGSGCRVLPPRACTADSAYPALLQKRLRIDVANMGVPLSTSANGLQRMGAALARRPALVLLEFGANDLFQGTSVDQARASMRDMVRAFQQRQVTVVLLSVMSPDVIANTPEGHRLHDDAELAMSYYGMLIELANAYDLLVVDTLLDSVWWNSDLMYDEVHPNGQGYLRVEQNIFAALEPLLAASGMLR
jgi:acyl-CoA thioesterase I